MKRSEFIKQTLVLLVVGVPVSTFTSGCYGGEDPPAPAINSGPKDCLANGTSANISANHGHSLNVSKDDVQDGVQKTYSIEGGAGHDHEVTITSTQFSSLKNNQSIQVDSTSGSGHTHSVTVNCA
jgi:hypothetical protein